MPRGIAVVSCLAVLGIAACTVRETLGVSDAGRAPSSPQDAGGGVSYPDAAHCEPIQDAGFRLLASGQACERDQQCAVLEVRAPCLRAFVCPVPLNGERDLGAYRSAAAEVADAFHACTEQCWVAGCKWGPDTPVRCDPDKARCVVDEEALRRRWRDADAADAGD